MKSSFFLLGQFRQRAAMSATTATTTTAASSFSVAFARRSSSALVSAVTASSSSNNNRGATTTLRSPLTTSTTVTTVAKRSHYSYSDGPGRFAFSDEAASERHAKRLQTWDERGFTVGIGGPVGSGKTALVLALIKRLGAKTYVANDIENPPLAVVTNDIFTQEDAQYLWKHQDVLPSQFIKAVETGGCPHAAIREDVSANLTACEDLTVDLKQNNATDNMMTPLILCESGGDNLAANFSSELADLTIYVIDVAGGDKVPRKGGPGITQSDLLVINKIDLAEAVGADLGVMRRDADRMRSTSGSHSHTHSHSHDHSHDHSHNNDDDEAALEHPESGPTFFASVKNGTSIDEIEKFILEKYRKATASVE